MRVRWSIAAIAAAMAFAAPAATAHASATISVAGDAIRYVGDDGPNRLDVLPVQDGEQHFDESDLTPGPGCRTVSPTPNSGAFDGNIACSLSGVTHFDFSFGGGADMETNFSTQVMTLPNNVDMGAGNDRYDFASTADDHIELGPGNDIAIDGIGNDTIDGGPGDDTVAGGDMSTGDDHIYGGDGNDNLDGYAGNDYVDGGAGDDILQSSPGDDTMLGGDGNDVIAGGDGNDHLDGGAGNDTLGGSFAASPGSPCGAEPGDDVLIGGAGDDQLCAGPGRDTLDGGDGNDALTSLDGAPDASIACGAGYDALWADAFDPVPLDCEQTSQPGVVPVPKSGVVPVTLPCPAGACKGKLSLYAAPRAAVPVAGPPPPSAPPPVSGGPLAKRTFKLHGNQPRKLKLRLSKSAAKRLRKLHQTTVVARTTFSSAGHAYSVARTFLVKPR